MHSLVQTFVVAVYYIELYHIPLLLLVLFTKCLVYKTVAEEVSPRVDGSRDEDDLEEEKVNACLVLWYMLLCMRVCKCTLCHSVSHNFK